MSLEELAEVGRDRSHAMDKGRNVEEPAPKIGEPREDLKDAEEIGTDEFAVVGRARSNMIDLGRKTEAPTLTPKGPGEDAPGLTKTPSVRESMGKRPEASTLQEGRGSRVK